MLKIHSSNKSGQAPNVLPRVHSMSVHATLWTMWQTYTVRLCHHSVEQCVTQRAHKTPVSPQNSISVTWWFSVKLWYSWFFAKWRIVELQGSYSDRYAAAWFNLELPSSAEILLNDALEKEQKWKLMFELNSPLLDISKLCFDAFVCCNILCVRVSDCWCMVSEY